MDWRGVNFDWNHARAFLVTAQEGSLSAAARVLGVAQPTLGRQVRALEQELDVALFERYGRGLELTPTGISLLDHVRSMADAANQLSLQAAGQNEAVAGRVRVSATDSMAAYLLPSILRDLRAAYPKITVELLATNTLSDLRRREADIALRAAEPTQPDLIARRLKDFHAYLYATPEYLRQRRTGNSIADLVDCEFIGFDDNTELLKQFNARGLAIGSDHFCVATENHTVHWELVKAGMGVGITMSAIGDAEPGVVRACDDFQPYVGSLWLVSHRELRHTRRVKAVFGFLAGRLTA
ncbi:LysR family transcriptional regulator [Gilvimarinus sp. SDUM040013]|uniref:LysR family transcriptional regulator n=1 Tax=Gilvimarinus gilvus TaxID=3058038 RepID=A0ABU4S2S1_9GAMM|nr:LysR family transcriptional regulator [Gilvimarinus sp. SDUM040013]MDO3386135.1 LysR family transcriptional regulator [Gilvimarinus sp. SDUM040013]MDX6851474.1 LysR family transcriptional regulator [Gilvimarinus sp. SDUM040013]